MTLFQSIENGDLKKVLKILKDEVNLDEKDDFGYHPLLRAINFGHLKIATALLNAGASPMVLNGYSLKNAIYKNRLDLLIFLLDRAKVDPNWKMEDDETALMSAALVGNIDAVIKLIEYGANPNLVSRKSDFALMNAAYKGWQNVYDYLLPLSSQKLCCLAQKELPRGLIYRGKNGNN